MVLALDLSLRVGVAVGRSGANEAPKVFAWKLPSVATGYGRISAALDQALCDAIDVFQPGRIVCEAPIRFKVQTSAELLLGLWWRVQETAWHHDIPVEAIASSTVRLGVLGTGKFPKGEAKPAVMRWLRENGYQVPYGGDDEADALILCLWALGYRAPKIGKIRS